MKPFEWAEKHCLHEAELFAGQNITPEQVTDYEAVRMYAAQPVHRGGAPLEFILFSLMIGPKNRKDSP